ncbi:MAG: zf-TFIIB domain-containing protein [Spirochaetota bacterium]|nr:zf-TFIIB domain-containing protein [Spirochaetota bacterium]
MNCPKCQKTNLTRVTEHQVELDYCGDCGGIWFDHGELEKITTMEATLSFDQIKKKETPMMMDYQTAMCPVCKHAMGKAPDRNLVNLMVDQCPKCKGIWLDGGEFNRLSGEHLMSKIKNYLL